MGCVLGLDKLEATSGAKLEWVQVLAAYVGVEALVEWPRGVAGGGGGGEDLRVISRSNNTLILRY